MEFEFVQRIKILHKKTKLELELWKHIRVKTSTNLIPKLEYFETREIKGQTEPV